MDEKLQHTFKTRNNPPLKQNRALFEDELRRFVENAKFHKFLLKKDKYLQKFHTLIEEHEILVDADKTCN